MAENTLAFNFIAKDNASRTFQKLGRESDGLGKKLAGFGKVAAVALGGAAVVGVTALGAAFVKGAKDAREYQVLSAKTAAVIKSTGNTANISVKGIQKLAANLEDLSGVEEELIINSENVLATFTKVRNETGKGNDIFDQATKAALDMSVALGTDLQSSTIQLGKALNDPIKGISALSRVGVSFTKEQKEQIAVLIESGDVMGAQKLILAELSTEFGGAAEAAGKVRGPVDRAKDALGDFARDMGAKILPGIDKLADWVTKTGVPALEDFVAYITDTLVPDVVAGFNDLKTKVENVLPDIDWSKLGEDIFDTAKGWATDIIDGFQEGLDTGDWKPLGRSLGEGLGKALTAVGDLGTKIEKTVTKWIGSVDWLEVGKKAAFVAVPFAVGFINELGVALVDFAIHHPVDLALLAAAIIPVGRIAGALATVVAKIPLLRVFAPLLEGLGTVGGWMEKAFGATLGRFFRFAGREFLSGFRGVIEIFSKYWGTRWGVFALEVWQKAESMLKGLGETLVRASGAPFRALGWVIAQMLRMFAGAGGWLVRAGLDILGGLQRGIVRAMAGIGGWIKRTIIDPIVGAVKRFFGIKSPSTVFAGIGGHLVGGLMKGLAQTSGTTIARKIFGDLPSALGHIVSKGLVSLASLPGKALKALGGLAGKIGGLFGGLFGGGGKTSSGPNAQLGQQLAAMRGWTGAQWDALNKLWTAESGWNNLAQNPTSSAFGIPQFINSTARQYGVLGSTSPSAQITAGMQYIADAYGSPSNAWAKWQSRSPHWYGAGGVISEPVFGVGKSGQSYVFGEKGPETVIPGRVSAGAVVHNHYHFDNYVGSRSELVRELESLRRQGRMA